MTIDPISVAAQLAQPSTTAAKTAETQTDFGSWLSSQVDSTNKLVADADNQVRHLAVGDAANLHDVMISLEKAKLSFQMVLQIRNKVLEAYQEVMRMQI